jgi:hypothetical protein
MITLKRWTDFDKGRFLARDYNGVIRFDNDNLEELSIAMIDYAKDKGEAIPVDQHDIAMFDSWIIEDQEKQDTYWFEDIPEKIDAK